MAVHELKTWPEYFQQIKSGIKTFELRKNDRDFKVGDTLLLKEYEPQGYNPVSPNDIVGIYTGEEIRVKVNYIFAGHHDGTLAGLSGQYCIMSISPESTPAIPSSIVRELKQVKEAVEWMWENMRIDDKTLVSDAFNIPANAITQLERLIESITSVPPSIVRRLEEAKPYAYSGDNPERHIEYEVWKECVSKLTELLSAQPDAATLEYYPTGGIDKDVVGDFFYANKVENATVEAQEFKSSDTRLSLMLVDNRVKAYVIETRTAFNNVMFIKGIVGNSVSAAQPAEQGGKQ